MSEDTLEQLMIDVAVLVEGRVAVSTDGTKSYVTIESRAQLLPSHTHMGYEAVGTELPNDEFEDAGAFLRSERTKLAEKYFAREDAATRGGGYR